METYETREMAQWFLFSSSSREEESIVFIGLVYEGSSPIHKVFPLRSSEAPPPSAVTLGIRISVHEFVGIEMSWLHSITLGLWLSSGADNSTCMLLWLLAFISTPRDINYFWDYSLDCSHILIIGGKKAVEVFYSKLLLLLFLTCVYWLHLG